jgi:hypothetical protein
MTRTGERLKILFPGNDSQELDILNAQFTTDSTALVDGVTYEENSSTRGFSNLHLASQQNSI